MESITVMEKIYRNNQFVLYINGLRGVITKESMLYSAVDVLSALGYEIKEINFTTSSSDELPNNEASYKPSTLSKRQPLDLCFHFCGENLLEDSYFKSKENLYINNILVAQSCNASNIVRLLETMGHPLTVEATHGPDNKATEELLVN